MSHYREEEDAIMTPRTLTPAARAFADACHSNSIPELEAALRARAAERTDCETWGITPSQWRLAIQTALEERGQLSSAAVALGRKGGQAGTPAQLAQRRAAAARGGRPAGWYRYDAGEEHGIVWVRGARTGGRVYDECGTPLAIDLPAGWRDHAERQAVVPAALTGIR